MDAVSPKARTHTLSIALSRRVPHPGKQTTPPIAPFSLLQFGCCGPSEYLWYADQTFVSTWRQGIRARQHGEPLPKLWREVHLRRVRLTMNRLMLVSEPLFGEQAAMWGRVFLARST